MMIKLIADILNKINFKAICGLAVGLSIAVSTFLWHNNNKLSESLEMAQNNIEAYQNMLNSKTTENNTLCLTVQQLENSKDSLINELNKEIRNNKINISKVKTAATQTQSIHVTGDREVEREAIQINTPNKHYNDSIQLNNLTTVYYDISEDTIKVELDIQNTQYLYTYKQKEWKNKKNLFKRIFTLDFKKVYKHRYNIVNTNDLINTSDVRIIEINN